MLWTDQVFLSVADLSSVDSEVSAVASANGLTLTGDGGSIRRGLGEASDHLLKRAVSLGGYVQNSGTNLSVNHLAAVLSTGVSSSVRTAFIMNQVVVSGPTDKDWSHVKRWAAHWCLYFIFRDCFNRSKDDRYETKMKNYRAELDWRLTPTLTSLGIPLVISPLDAPAAAMSPNSGIWANSSVSLEADAAGTLTDQVDVAVTYVDLDVYGDDQDPKNGESSASEKIVVQLESGKVLKVDISSLNPPTGAQDKRYLPYRPVSFLTASGWNLYVGLSGGTMYLQNSAPIPIATKSLQLTGNPQLSGSVLMQGQIPDSYFHPKEVRQRA